MAPQLWNWDFLAAQTFLWVRRHVQIDVLKSFIFRISYSPPLSRNFRYRTFKLRVFTAHYRRCYSESFYLQIVLLKFLDKCSLTSLFFKFTSNFVSPYQKSKPSRDLRNEFHARLRMNNFAQKPCYRAMKDSVLTRPRNTNMKMWSVQGYLRHLTADTPRPFASFTPKFCRDCIQFPTLRVSQRKKIITERLFSGRYLHETAEQGHSAKLEGDRLVNAGGLSAIGWLQVLGLTVIPSTV